MGQALDFPTAYAKAQLAAGQKLPLPPGPIFISVHDGDKSKAAEIAMQLETAGYQIIATHNTAKYFLSRGVAAKGINKLREGTPHIVDALGKKEVAMVINTTLSKAQVADSYVIRRTALEQGIPHYTTISAARAVTESLIAIIQKRHLQPVALQGF